jgi:hypothetical protein
LFLRRDIFDIDPLFTEKESPCTSGGGYILHLFLISAKE